MFVNMCIFFFHEVLPSMNYLDASHAKGLGGGTKRKSFVFLCCLGPAWHEKGGSVPGPWISENQRILER